MLWIEGRKLKNKHLVQGGFLEEAIRGQVLRGEQGLGIGGGQGLHFN